MENNVNEQEVRQHLHKVEYILFLILVISGSWWFMTKIKAWVSRPATEKPVPVIIKTAEPFTSTLSTSTTKVKMAFLADQGNTVESRRALALVREEQAEVLVVLGGFEYENSPEVWKQNLDDHLGVHFPVIAVAGDHEEESWEGYASVVAQKIGLLPPGMCQAETLKDLGLTFDCDLGAVHMVLTTPDIVIAQAELRNPAAYIQKIFKNEIANRTFLYMDDNTRSSPNDQWRLCGWHKLHPDLRLGRGDDVIHWDIYDACRKFGAYIISGHDPVYARSKTVLDFSKPVIATSSPAAIQVRPGSSGVSIVGLGGMGIGRQDIEHSKWWAETYTLENLQKETDKKQQHIAGVLFCTFDRDEMNAPCYFKTTDGKVRDEFKLVR